jgi:hypothetical protein
MSGRGVLGIPQNHGNYQDSPEDLVASSEISESMKLTARLFKYKVEQDLFNFVDNITMESNKLNPHRVVIFKRIQHIVSSLFQGSQ